MADMQRRSLDRPTLLRWSVLLWLCAATAAVFAPLRHAEFLNYDDPVYVTENTFVTPGFTWPGFVWAWTSADVNWHPLTWLSHMLDCHLFGVQAGAHHLMNIGLHVLNAGLLLHVLFRYSGALWPSALAAALFALHPLHVESVAWVAERKDLLSTAAWLAALLAYRRYTERPGAARMAPVALAMALSLLSKGMAVTLPVTLLALDYWPLERWPQPATAAVRRWALVREKWPLFLLAAAGTAMTVFAQRTMGALRSVDDVPLSMRLANALVSYAAYGRQTLWPADLAVPYPLAPHGPNAASVALALAALALVSGMVARYGPTRRYLVTGWIWYLVTLLPVIGLVQIGYQSRADRYTYVPLIGLFVMAAWGAADLAGRRPATRPAVVATMSLALLLCAARTRDQLRYWHDSLALFEHTLAVTDDNPFAENNYGVALKDAGRRDEARTHFVASVRLEPNNAEAQNNVGVLLLEEGRLSDAEPYFRAALQRNVNFFEAHVNLAAVLLRRGDAGGAAAHFAAAAALHPTDPEIHQALARALETAGQVPAAIAAYERALALDPTLPGVHYRLARLLESAHRQEDAIRHYREQVRLFAAYPDAENALGAALNAAGRRDEARTHIAAAVRLEPSNGKAHNNLGVLLLEDDDYVAAATHLREAMRLLPNEPSPRINLGMLELRRDNLAEARQHFEAAAALDPDQTEVREALRRLQAAAGDAAGPAPESRARAADAP